MFKWQCFNSKKFLTVQCTFESIAFSAHIPKRTLNLKAETIKTIFGLTNQVKRYVIAEGIKL